MIDPAVIKDPPCARIRGKLVRKPAGDVLVFPVIHDPGPVEFGMGMVWPTTKLVAMLVKIDPDSRLAAVVFNGRLTEPGPLELWAAADDGGYWHFLWPKVTWQDEFGWLVGKAVLDAESDLIAEYSLVEGLP